jgi:hypothetical protein
VVGWLKFPHHECEIAQGEAAHGHSPVNYWMHANMLTLEGKMSKSTGNSIFKSFGRITILWKRRFAQCGALLYDAGAL